MIDSAAWTSLADPRRRIGREIEFHAVIASTNDRARALLLAPGTDGTVVVADRQTAGRGRRGRSWLSPRGTNLMLSVGLRPSLEAGRAWWLGAAAALAVLDAAGPWAALSVKWPNDILDAGGDKVAGLLLETAVEGERVTEAIIGLGINVNWRRAEMPAEIADSATSLADLAGMPVERTELLGRILASLDREVARLEAGISPIERYRMASAIDGLPVRVLVEGGRLEGIAVGIADDGSLLLDTPRGRVAIAHGEVTQLRVAEEVPA